MTSPSDRLPTGDRPCDGQPPWLDGLEGRDRVRAIVAAVANCYASDHKEIAPGEHHMTAGVAEELLAGMLESAGAVRPHQLGCICAELLAEGGDFVDCPVHNGSGAPFAPQTWGMHGPEASRLVGEMVQGALARIGAGGAPEAEVAAWIDRETSCIAAAGAREIRGGVAQEAIAGALDGTWRAAYGHPYGGA